MHLSRRQLSLSSVLRLWACPQPEKARVSLPSPLNVFTGRQSKRLCRSEGTLRRTPNYSYLPKSSRLAVLLQSCNHGLSTLSTGTCTRREDPCLALDPFEDPFVVPTPREKHPFKGVTFSRRLCISAKGNPRMGITHAKRRRYAQQDISHLCTISCTTHRN